MAKAKSSKNFYKDSHFVRIYFFVMDCFGDFIESPRNDEFFWILRFAQNDNVFWLDSAFFVLFSTRFCESAESSVFFTSAKRGSILEIKSWFCETSDEDRTHKSIEEAS